LSALIFQDIPFNMKYILHGSVISIGLLIISSAFSAPFSSSAEYEAAMQRAEKNYVTAREICDALKNHAQDVCIAEARAERKRQEADAEAAEKRTSEARTKALHRYAAADLQLGRMKCEVYRGNDNDVCLKRAQLEHESSVSVAKADQEVMDAHQKAMEEISEADYELEL